MPDPKTETERVSIAHLTRPRGRRGELAAVALSDHAERFQQLDEVFLVGAESFPDEVRKFRVEEVWEHGNRLVFKFRGIDSISETEGLRGADVCIPAAERFPLPEGEYYQSDLVGCVVRELDDGRELGRVEAFLEVGGNGVLQVNGPRGELLVPFAREICVEVDPDSQRIGVRLPKGLEDLNNS